MSPPFQILIGKPKIESDGSILLEELNNFKNTWELYKKRSDVPVFFHIPKAGGSSIKNILGTCHRIVMATDKGITGDHEDDPALAVVYPGGGPPGTDRTP